MTYTHDSKPPFMVYSRASQTIRFGIVYITSGGSFTYERGCRRSSTILVQLIQYVVQEIKAKRVWLYDTTPAQVISSCRAARPDPLNSIIRNWI